MIISRFIVGDQSENINYWGWKNTGQYIKDSAWKQGIRGGSGLWRRGRGRVRWAGDLWSFDHGCYDAQDGWVHTGEVRTGKALQYSNPNVDIDKTEIDIVDGVANIKLDEMAKFDQQSYMDVTFARFRIAKDIWDNIEEITKVNFVDAFEKRDESEDEDEEAEE